jgi:hypothetical protein
VIGQEPAPQWAAREMGKALQLDPELTLLVFDERPAVEMVN